MKRVVNVEGILRQFSYDRYWAKQKGVEPTTERGILVTHFCYIRFLDRRAVLLTGLTRDGTFLIEKGKITQALKNFRWNESPLFMLGKIGGQVVPALKVKDFNFTSLSDAV